MATNALNPGSHSQPEDELIRKLAQMLSGYDDATWERLKRGRKLTYIRAAQTLFYQRIDFMELLGGK